VAQIIFEKQDLTWLEWTRTRHSSGTAGSFLKAYDDFGGRKTYYKLSNYHPVNGIVGHECVNEIIVDRLLSILGVEHLHYQLIHADVLLDGQVRETWLCASEDYKKPGESKIALDALYQSERLDRMETPMQFCERMGWKAYVDKMLAVDFLILNRDRHGANIEVLRDGKRRTMRLSPLFDHGLSLLFQCETEETLAAEDVMADKPVQCFVGSRSARDNLNLISEENRAFLRKLKSSDRKILLDGLDACLPRAWQDKIWEMILKRWKAYEDFCHQG